MPLVLGLLALVGLGLAISHGSKSAVDTSGMPAALVAQINVALDSADPNVMRRVALTVRSAGFPTQAASLEEAATAIEQAITNTPVTRAGVNPAPKADDPKARALAGKLAMLLSGMSATEARASQEVKNLVLAYEGQEKGRGFYVGNLDGLFGPKAALSLAQDHGIVPPHPLYWPKSNTPAAKQAYRSALAAYVAADAQRAEEWTQAMNVDT